MLEDSANNHHALCAFILGYITAEVQTLSMMASSESSSDPLLAMVLDGLQMPFRFEPPKASGDHFFGPVWLVAWHGTESSLSLSILVALNTSFKFKRVDCNVLCIGFL